MKKALLGLCGMVVLLACAAEARGGAPPLAPPHVALTHDHLLSSALVVRGDVALVNAADRVLAADASDVRFVPLPGSLPASVRVDHGHYELTAASSGTYAARVESPTHPELASAELRVRIMAPNDLVPVVLRLNRTPPDRTMGELLSVSQDDFAMIPSVAVSRAEARVALAPGTYTITWHGRGASPTRRTRVQIGPGGGVVAADFAGSRVSFKADFFPDNGKDFELVIEHDGGGEDVFRLYTAHSTLPQLLSYDVAPGKASISLRETQPFAHGPSPTDRSAWTERYRGRIDIAHSSELAIAWSMPRLFGGRSPALGPWQELPGLSLAAQEMPGRPDAFFVDHGAVAWFEGPKLRTLLGGVITLAPGKDLGTVAPGPIAALGASLFAWASGEKVFYRTPRGISAEALPTYVLAPGTSTFPPPPPGPPYPCDATGIAIPSESELVVVGRCRGNSPDSDNVPHEGFIAERDSERWRRLPERPPPLRAMASDGNVVVAVGDGGTVMWRRGGKWTQEKSTKARSGLAFVEVGLADGRAFARTKQGDIFDLASKASPLPTFDEPRPGSRSVVKRRSRQMCLTKHGPAAWFGRETLLESSGGLLPDRIALWEGGRWRVVFSGGERGSNVEALACDGDTIWLVTSDVQKPVSVRTISAASATAAATIIW